MMNISKLLYSGKFREFLFPGIIIILIVLSTVTVLRPKIGDLFQLRQNLSKQKEELSKLSLKVAVLEGYDQNELKTRTDQLLKVLPVEKDAPMVLAIIRSLASQYSLGLENLTIDVGEIATESAKSTSKKEELLPSLDCQLSLTGSLNDFYNFLEAIETTAPIMKINDFNFTREGTSIESKIQLVSYYLVMPKSIGVIDREIIPITSEEERVYEELSRYKPAPAGLSLPWVGSGKENPFAY